MSMLLKPLELRSSFLTDMLLALPKEDHLLFFKVYVSKDRATEQVIELSSDQRSSDRATERSGDREIGVPTDRATDRSSDKAIERSNDQATKRPSDERASERASETF